jgi:hypothetical protein
MSVCAVLIVGLGLGPTGTAARGGGTGGGTGAGAGAGGAESDAAPGPGECPDFDVVCSESSQKCKTGMKPALIECENEAKTAQVAGGALDPVALRKDAYPDTYQIQTLKFLTECWERVACVRMPRCNCCRHTGGRGGGGHPWARAYMVLVMGFCVRVCLWAGGGGGF